MKLINEKKIYNIGIIFGDKENDKENIFYSRFSCITNIAKKNNLQIIYINLDIPIERQGKFDLIVLKINCVIDKAQKGNKKEQFYLSNITNYINNNLHVIIMDPLENILNLTNREIIFNKIISYKFYYDKDLLFCYPKTIKIKNGSYKLLSKDISFPIICKPISAYSHSMVILHSFNQIANLKKYYNENEELIIQEFIHHDGILIKVYNIDDNISFDFCPSFEISSKQKDIIYFNTLRLPKKIKGNCEDISPNLVDVFQFQNNDKIITKKIKDIDKNRIYQISLYIKKCLNISLFGFDILLTNDNKYYIIDINYFPSFRNFPKFEELFINSLLKKLEKKN